MFTAFLIGTAAVVSAWMASLLPRGHADAKPLKVSIPAVTVATGAAALVGLGLWLM